MQDNVINNKVLASITRQAAPPVIAAIKKASARTGVNFAYLVEQAAAESSFNAKAKSRSSSATGLYQFIESTWLSMVKKHGHKHGLDAFAAKIGDNGKVADRAVRQEILELRKNPEKAALLAAEFAAENQRYLQRHVGGEIGATELYFAHFMGAGGAAGFLNALKENPLQAAADLFPKAANANQNVFYDSKTGQPRTLAGVYDFFAKKFQASENAGIMPDETTQASGTPPPPTRKPVVTAFVKTYDPPASGAFYQDDLLSITALPNPFARLEREDSEESWLRQKTTLAPRGPLFNPVELMLLAQAPGARPGR